MTVAELEVVLKADIANLRRAMSDGRREVDGFATSAKTSAQGAERSFTQSFDSILSKARMVGVGMTAALTAPIIALGKSTFEAATRMEGLNSTLSIVMGSASAAAGEFRKLSDSARLPGMDLQQAVQGSANLQAIGFSAEQARFMLEQYSNAIAKVGGGREEFQRTVYNLTQIGSAAKLTGDELKEMSMIVGPEFRQAMQKAFGTMDSATLAKMGISGKQAIAMIAQELSKTARANENTMKNMVENFQQDLFQLKADVGAALIPIARDILPKIIDSIRSAVTWFKNLSPALQQTVIKVAALAAAAGPLMIALSGVGSGLSMIIKMGTAAAGALSAAAGGAGALRGAMVLLTGPVGWVIGAAGLIYAAWATNFGGIQDVVGQFVNQFRAWWRDIAPVVKQVLDQWVFYFKLGWQMISTVVEQSLKWIGRLFGIYLKNIQEMWEFAIGGVSLLLAGLSGDTDRAMRSMGMYAAGAAMKFEAVWIKAISAIAGRMADFVDGIKAAAGAVGVLTGTSGLVKNVPNPFRGYSNAMGTAGAATSNIGDAWMDQGRNLTGGIGKNPVGYKGAGQQAGFGFKFSPVDPMGGGGKAIKADGEELGKLLMAGVESGIEKGSASALNTFTANLLDMSVKATTAALGQAVPDMVSAAKTGLTLFDTYATEAETKAKAFEARWSFIWYSIAERAKELKDKALKDEIRAHEDFMVSVYDVQLKQERAKIAEQMEYVKTMTANAAEGISDVIMGAFSNMGKGWRGIMDGMLSGFQNMLADMGRQWLQAQVTRWITGAIGGLFGGGLGGNPDGSSGGLPGVVTGNATGGPVLAGNAYRVGENGPELFVPSGNGRIVSNAAMGGGGGGITVNIHTPDAESFRRSKSQVAAQIGDVIQRAKRRGG